MKHTNIFPQLKRARDIERVREGGGDKKSGGRLYKINAKRYSRGSVKKEGGRRRRREKHEESEYIYENGGAGAIGVSRSLWYVHS